MKNVVYVTYEAGNNQSSKIAGIYANEKLALKAIKNEEVLDNIIDCYPLQGCKDDLNAPIEDGCKYYKPHMNTIRELIACLYNLDGCCAGGLCHIITDDDNIDDPSLKTVIIEAKKHPEATESGLSILICEELLKLSLQERALLFSSYYNYDVCCKECCMCEIGRGVISKN